MPHLHANGINLYYQEQGSGEPLMLIMGFTLSSSGWRWNFGKEEGLVPPENSVTLARRIPNADLVILSNASHLFNIELPETTAETVKGFIRRRREWMGEKAFSSQPLAFSLER